MATEPKPRIDLRSAVESFEEGRYDAYQLIKEGVRLGCKSRSESEVLHADNLVISAVATLASVNCFDDYYKVACAYLQSQQECSWSDLCSLCGEDEKGVLGHLIRIAYARKKQSFGLQSLSLKYALADARNDCDIQFLYREIIEEADPSLRGHLENIIKKS